MSARFRAFGQALAALVVAAPLAAAPQAKPQAQAKPGAEPKADATASRDGLETLEARLDRAADRVSLPHAARLLGRAELARGYRLPGYGLVLVLTPRALPAGEGRVYVIGPDAKTHRLHGEPRPKAAGQTVVVHIDDSDRDGVETFERQVLVLQHETEAARVAAEEEMDRIARDVRVRIAPPAPPDAPTPPPAATPPSPRPVAAAAQTPEPPEGVAPPAAPEAPTSPLPPAPPVAWTTTPPPWKFWFETGSPADTRAPEAVIADVRASLVDTLASADPGALGLAAEERVTVAVDFVSGGLFVANARPSHTLLVSLRVRDAAARARGAISADELHRRVEVSEY
jgi:hypothetical protein